MIYHTYLVFGSLWVLYIPECVNDNGWSRLYEIMFYILHVLGYSGRNVVLERDDGNYLFFLVTIMNGSTLCYAMLWLLAS